MSQQNKYTAFCNIELNFAQDVEVPTWIHVLAVNENGTVATLDGRGPWKLTDAQAVMQRSLNSEGGKLLIDVNHATDHNATNGKPAPAVGWVVELDARDDGLWGKVEWNANGADLVKNRAYRAISPAIVVNKKTNEVFAVPRMSLTNIPNLRDIVALNQQMETTMLQTIAEMLGLSAEASEEDVMAALEKALAKPKADEGGDKGVAELNSARPKLAKALGLNDDADIATILNAVETAPNADELGALQKQVGELSTQLNSATEATATKEAEAFVDAAIVDGRVGVNQASRDRYIKMHLNSKEDAEAIINGLPKLTGTTFTAAAPSKDGEVQLNAAQSAVAAQLGVSEKDYAAELSTNQEEVA